VDGGVVNGAVVNDAVITALSRTNGTVVEEGTALP
jgi:hypothetical protein